VSAVVTTGPGALLTVEVEGRTDPFVYHGNECQAVVAQHETWAHAMAVDLKHEKRWPAWMRARRLKGPQVVAKRDKVNRRLRGARHLVTTMIVNFLVRQKVGYVAYHDKDKSFLPRWDWSGMKEMFRYKCEGAGIHFHHATPGGAEAEEPDVPHPEDVADGERLETEGQGRGGEAAGGEGPGPEVEGRGGEGPPT
jgi:hypothetical protein